MQISSFHTTHFCYYLALPKVARIAFSMQHCIHYFRRTAVVTDSFLMGTFREKYGTICAVVENVFVRPVVVADTTSLTSVGFLSSLLVRTSAEEAE